MSSDLGDELSELRIAVESFKAEHDQLKALTKRHVEEIDRLNDLLARYFGNHGLKGVVARNDRLWGPREVDY